MRVGHFTSYSSRCVWKVSLTLVFDMGISRSSKYRDLMWAIELNRFALEIIGLWPKTDFKENFGSALRLGFTFVMITFVNGIPIVCALIRVWGDMTLMVENLQFTLPCAVIVLKLIIMWWKRAAVSTIIKMITEDWMELRESEERDVMIKRARVARFIVVCEYGLTVLSFVVAIVLPLCGVPFRHFTNLTDRERVLPLQTYYYYNTDKSPLFELTCIAQAITIFLLAVSFMSIDGFLGLAIFHICGQLENFKCGLANLILRKDFNNVLKKRIATHLRLIKFAGNIEDIYTLMMLSVIICFATTFCLYAFLLLSIIQPKDKINTISVTRICYIMMAIFNSLMQTFLYCGAGELVTEQCDAVYRALCDLEWYTLDSRKTKNLILLMIRASEPFRITAGKIVPLTMTTFCNLLKTSAGYISFLLARRS